MKKINIVRIGQLGASPHRYIDLFEKHSVEKIFLFLEDKRIADEITETFRLFDSEDVIEKINFIYYSTSFFDKLLMKLANKFNNNLFLYFIENFGFKSIKNELSKIEQKYLLWIGENDFDNSNYMHIALKNIIDYKKLKVLKSYKETRFNFRLHEKLSLQRSDALILPNPSYKEFFSRMYGKDFIDFKKVRYCDQDQRSLKQYNFLKKFHNLEKFSFRDNIPRLAIISGVAACYPCNRSGDRYVLLDKIEKVLKEGIAVNLYTKRIVGSVSDQKKLKNNAYHDLQKKYQNFSIDFRQMSLNSDVYEDICKCDFGLLHGYVKEGRQEVTEFQKINVANRFYEYLCAGIVPVCEKNSFFETEQEKVIKRNGGVLFKGEEELLTLMKIRMKSKNTFNYTNDYPENFMLLAEELL